MKRLTVFLIGLMTVCCLSGCSNRADAYERAEILAEQMALEKANELFENGDYQGAIDAYMSISSYAEVVRKIEEAEQHLSDEKYISITGEGLTYTWYVKNPGSDTWVESSVTSGNYSCKMTPEKTGRQVYCVITDAAGNTIQSDVTTLIYGD